MKRYQRLIEMARVGKVKDLEIQVYTDHEPKHFHLLKSGQYEARILIPKKMPESIDNFKVVSYKFQKSKDDVVTNQDLKLLLNWLGKKDSDLNTITNFESMNLLWRNLNP